MLDIWRSNWMGMGFTWFGCVSYLEQALYWNLRCMSRIHSLLRHGSLNPISSSAWLTKLMASSTVCVKNYFHGPTWVAPSQSQIFSWRLYSFNISTRQIVYVFKFTILSHTDIMATLMWQNKGSTISTSAPEHIVQEQAVHQKHHNHVPLHEFPPGVGNGISDLPSRSVHISCTQLLDHF